MTTFFYMAFESEPAMDYQSEFMTYAGSKGLKGIEFSEDHQSVKISWHKRAIAKVLERAQAGDHIVTYGAATLVNSTAQMLELLLVAFRRGIAVHFIKYDEALMPEKRSDTEFLIRFLLQIESDFIARRTTDALARRRDNGLPLGRPKGSKNKALKLDKCRPEIEKYLTLNISKASIAKLVGCHPQTLYDWLAKNGFETTPVARRKLEASQVELEVSE